MSNVDPSLWFVLWVVVGTCVSLLSVFCYQTNTPIGRSELYVFALSPVFIWPLLLFIMIMDWITYIWTEANFRK